MKTVLIKYSEKKPFIVRTVLVMLSVYLVIMIIATWWNALSCNTSWHRSAMNLLEFYLLSGVVIIVLTSLFITSTNRLIEDRFESERRRRLIADAMAHDMKTPLSIMRNYAELLADEESCDNRRRYAQTIIDESVNMNNTVVNMLDLSKMEAGTYPMDLSDFNLTEVLKAELLRHKVLLEEKNINVREEIPEDIIMFADRKLISMAFTNFITNSIRYGKEGSDLTVSVEKNRNKIRISVHNVGSPIPDEDLPHIWDTFYQVNDRNVRSNGLGLAIVRHICQMHGGKYGCLNENGGIRFWFEISSQDDRLLQTDVLTGPVINVTGNQNSMGGVISIAIGTIIQAFFGTYAAFGFVFRVSALSDIIRTHASDFNVSIFDYDYVDAVSLIGMAVGSVIILKGINILMLEHKELERNKTIISFTILTIVIEEAFAILSMTVLNLYGVKFIIFSNIPSIALFILLSIQLILNYLMISRLSLEAGNHRRSRALKSQVCVITLLIALLPILAITDVTKLIPWDVGGCTWFVVSVFSAGAWIKAARNR